MRGGRLALALTGCLLGLAAPAAAQRGWVEATGPNVTVISDAGAGRARDIAWQFEQIREAVSRTFPWIRVTTSRPLVVWAARNVTTMRTLAPGLWDHGNDGALYVSTGGVGRDYRFSVVRADYRLDDREGVSPYQAAYWSFTAQALGETSPNLPDWLVRGLSELLSNTLVRDKEIQVGRTLPQNLQHLRTRPRLSLKDVVATVTGNDREKHEPEELFALDAHAWAFVHFLVWADKGAHAPLLNKYVAGLLNGADPLGSLSSTLGDVSRFEPAFNVYVNRDLFYYASYATSARLTREGFAVRDLPDLDATVMRARLHAAMSRPDDARKVLAESEALGAAGGAAEVEAMLADAADDDDQLLTALERAVAKRGVSWWAPYRLATLLDTGQDRASRERVASLLAQATAANPNADDAWSYLGEVLAALGRGEEAIAAAEKAIVLVPASSGHRISLARIYLRLERYPEGIKAAGLGRAIARTPAERDHAQRTLADLARATAPPAARDSDPADAPSRPPAAAPAPDLLAGGAATIDTDRTSIGGLINACYEDNALCREVLPKVVADCTAGRSESSTGACREAGYIHDAGVGVPARAALAADYYRIACDRQDELACVRLATLRSLGRGVPRDAAAALAVLEASCGRGLQEACYRLGLHLSATGAAGDRTRARAVLTASCAAEFAESCAALKKLPER